MELTINGKFTREGQHYKDKNFNMIPIKKKRLWGHYLKAASCRAV